MYRFTPIACIALLVQAAPPYAPADYPDPADHRARPARRRRTDRHRGPAGRRIDDRHPRPAAAGRECRRRRQHRRHGPRRPGRAGRLHAAAQPCRPGHRAPRLYRKLSYDPDRRLRRHRPHHRRADDHRRPGRLSRRTRSASCSSTSRPTRRTSPTPTPASARRRICAACCSWTRSTCR